MRKTILLLTLLLSSLAVTPAFAGDDAQRIKTYEPDARKGDYQAQRNLAFTLCTSSNPSVRNPVLGCAWYKLILRSGNPKIDQGDIGNVTVYCGALSPAEQSVAEGQAARLHQEIYLK